MDRKIFDDPPPTYVDPNDNSWKKPGEFEVEKSKSHVRPKDPVIKGKQTNPWFDAPNYKKATQK